MSIEVSIQAAVETPPTKKYLNVNKLMKSVAEHVSFTLASPILTFIQISNNFQKMTVVDKSI